MSYARRVAYNTIVQMIGRLVTSGVSLVTVTLLNSGFQPERWGIYVALTTYINLFATIADLGISTVYLRELSQHPDDAEAVSKKYLGFRFVTAAVLLGSAPLISLLVPVYHQYSEFISILAVGQFFLILNQLFVSFVQARLLMGWASLSDLCGRLLVMTGTFFVFRDVPQPHQLFAVTLTVVGGSILNMLITFLVVGRMVPLRLEFRWREWPALLRQVAPLSALVVLSLIHFKADSFILALVKPPVDVGIYGNAYKIIEIYLLLPGIFVGSVFPALTQAGSTDPKRLMGLFQKAFDLIIMSVVPLVLFTVLLAPYIIGVLTRYNIAQSAYALQILAFSIGVWFVIYLVENTLIALYRQVSVSLVEGAAAVFNIALNLWAIPRYSYVGAAYTTFISELAAGICVCFLLYRVMRYLPSLFAVGSAAVGAFIVGIFCWAVRAHSTQWLTTYLGWHRLTEVLFLLLALSILSLVYVIPLWVLGLLPPVLKERLPAGLSR